MPALQRESLRDTLSNIDIVDFSLANFILENINIGNGLGILGILVGYYLYSKSKTKYRLHYVVRETSVVSLSGPEISEYLEIFFTGRKVPRVTSSKIILWNTGNAPISPEDFLSENLLKVSFAENQAEVLEASVLEADTPENGARVRVDENNSVVLEYEVIRPKEGVVLEILHTGSSGSIKLSGKIRRESHLIYRSSSLFDSDELFHPLFPFKRVAFPVVLLFMLLFFAWVAGKFAYAGIIGISKVSMMAKDAGWPTYGFEKMVTSQVAGYGDLVIFCLTTVFFIQDLYRGWTSTPSRKVSSAFRR